MTASTLNLSAFETRLGNFLADSGSTLWTIAEKDEALRLALADFSRCAGAALAIEDLDSAAATTLDQLDEALLIRGAAAYAARTRALARSQAPNLAQSMPANLLEWAKNLAYTYDLELKKVRGRYLNQSTASPSSPLTWDESDKNW